MHLKTRKTMRVIEITEDKREKLSHNVEKALKYMGKVMQCIDTLDDDEEIGYRENESRGYRGGMGNREPMGRRRGGGSMGERDDEWEDDDDMGERRRDSRGRYRR